LVLSKLKYDYELDNRSALVPALTSAFKTAHQNPQPLLPQLSYLEFRLDPEEFTPKDQTYSVKDLVSELRMRYATDFRLEL